MITISKNMLIISNDMTTTIILTTNYSKRHFTNAEYAHRPNTVAILNSNKNEKHKV